MPPVHLDTNPHIWYRGSRDHRTRTKPLFYKHFRHNLPRGYRPDPMASIWSYSRPNRLKDTDRESGPPRGVTHWVGATRTTDKLGGYSYHYRRHLIPKTMWSVEV